MDISDNGLNLIKVSEGLRLTVYLDQAGHPTVGYGHKDDSMNVGDTITQDDADTYLQSDVQSAVNDVNKMVTVELNQNQFDALCDFVYNLGGTEFSTSTLLRLINQGDFDDAANEFPKWDHAGGKVDPGLLTRRQREQALFQS